ncbi:hypothetical protein SLA2020_048930 [Shorea laevis]
MGEGGENRIHSKHNQSHHPQHDARTSVHQLQLQHSYDFANHRIVTRMETFLPIHLVCRRLVVPLHHLHLENPLPNNDHALIDELPAKI